MKSLILLVLLNLEIISANPDAKRLYDDLLSNYNRLIRPVSNHTEKVTVKLGLRLSQLVDLVSRFGMHNNLSGKYDIYSYISEFKRSDPNYKRMDGARKI